MFRHQIALEFRKVSKEWLVFLGVSEATSFEAFPTDQHIVIIFFRQFQKQYPGMHRGPVEALEFFLVDFHTQKMWTKLDLVL